MTTKQNRSRGTIPGAAEVASTATASIADAAVKGVLQRHRCTYCRHKLTDPLSVARGFGPTCWRRLERVQLDDRRETVGRRLRDVAALVARADARGLSFVAAALVDLLDALDAEGVAR